MAMYRVPYEIIILENPSISLISREIILMCEKYSYSVFYDESKILAQLEQTQSPAVVIAEMSMLSNWETVLLEHASKKEHMTFILADEIWNSEYLFKAAKQGYFDYLSLSDPYFHEKLQASLIRASSLIQKQIDSDEKESFGRLLVDPDTGEIFEVTEQALTMLGLSLDQVIGTPLRKLLHKSDTVSVIKDFQQIDKKPLKFELYRPDNTILPVIAQPRLVNYENNKVIQVILRDISEQRYFQSLIRESEIHLKSIIDHMPDGIITMSETGNVHMLNQAAEQMLGCRQSDLIGIKIEDIFPQGLPEIGSTIETRIIHKNGDQLTVALNIGQYTVNQNFFEIVVLHDMSEIHEKNKELQTLVLRLNSLIDNIPSGVIVEDRNRNIVLVNSNFCQMFSLSLPPEKLEGTNCPRIFQQGIHLFKNPKQFFHDVEVLIDQEDLCINQSIELYDGRTLEFDFIPLKSGTDNYGAMWLYRDISQRKMGEKQLEYRTTLLNAISDASTNLLTENDHNKAINKALSVVGKALNVDRICVYQETEEGEQRFANLVFEWVEKNISSLQNFPLLKRMNTPGIFTHREQLAKGKRIISIARNLPKPTRNILEEAQIISAVLIPLFAEGNFWGFLAFDNCTDEREWNKYELSEMSTLSASIGGMMARINYANTLKKANQELVNMNQNLQKSLQFAEKMATEAKKAARAKSDFLSNMSHEIRTPLNAVIGLTNLLINEHLTEKQHENLETIKSSSDTLLRTVNDILDFSKIEAGKVAFENIDFEPKKLISQIVNTFQYKVGEKGIELSVEMDKKLPIVLKGDPYRLSQILNNIINNAIKFTQKGGIKIKIRTEQFEAETNQCTLLFSVADTGIGISKEKISSLFDSFTQAHRSTVRNYGGTGLGLAICRKLIELQGGVIGVDSKAGQGSTFWFALTFAISTLESLQENERETTFEKSLEGLNILMAEDNPANQFLARQIFEHWKSSLDVASNGDEALAMMTEKKYDILLLDLQMPVKDGFETLKTMQKKKEKLANPDIPVIALSADVFIETKKKVAALGANDYVLKPFDENELYEKIANLTKIKTKFQNRPIQKMKKEDSSSSVLTSTDNKEVDLSYLKLVTNNNQDAFARILKIYAEQVVTLGEEFRKNYTALDYDNLGHIAHKLKPLFQTLGSPKLQHIYQEIETLAKEPDKKNIKELAEEAISLSAIMGKKLNEICASL
jgi:PAS domain S-box-containing protein